MPHVLSADNITIGYDSDIIAKDLSITIDKPQIISIIGPNGAGKSTVLKALSRILKPKAGNVFLDGQEIHTMPGKAVARIIAMLPQSSSVPDDFLVSDLVACGRTPYQARFSGLTKYDKEIIIDAMQKTDAMRLHHRRVSDLSGGERQRVWLAMAIAQQPQILLLDEPTTFLDIHHQLEIMELVRSLHEQLCISVVMVLHDLNHAVRYSQRIVAIKNGSIYADGAPEKVLTEENFEYIYDVKAKKIMMKQDGEEYCVFMPYAVCHAEGEGLEQKISGKESA